MVVFNRRVLFDGVVGANPEEVTAALGVLGLRAVNPEDRLRIAVDRVRR